MIERPEDGFATSVAHLAQRRNPSFLNEEFRLLWGMTADELERLEIACGNLMTQANRIKNQKRRKEWTL